MQLRPILVIGLIFRGLQKFGIFLWDFTNTSYGDSRLLNLQFNENLLSRVLLIVFPCKIKGENINWEDKIRHEIVDCEYDLTPIPMCMPDEYVKTCAVSSYRAYYKSKADINSWNWGRNQPEWY